MSQSRYARDYYVKRGWAPHIAAGAVGNYMQESGPDLNPNAYNKAEDAYGIGQWRGERLANLRRFAAENGRELDNIDTQLDFSIWEKENTEKAAWSKIQGARDADEAASLFDQYYERSAGLHTPQRQAYARSLMDEGPGALSDGSRPLEFLPDQVGTPMFPSAPPLDLSNGVMSSRNEPERIPREGMWGKFLDWTSEGNRSNQLLAIGSGLLSGDNWASGIAGSSTNLLNVNTAEQDRQTDLAEREEDLEQRRIENAQRQQQIDQNGQESGRAYPIGNIMMPDGSVIGDALADSDGYFRYGENGERIPISGGERVNNSDSFGSKGQPTFEQATQQQEEIITTGHSLEAMDKLMEKLPTIPTGISGLVSDIDKIYKTATEQGLDLTQLDRADVQAELQTLIGGLRLDIVGPGTMTEQDAVRIVAAIGGDMQDFLSNPEVALQRITTIRERTYGRYNQQYEQYDATIKRFPRNGYLPVDRYVPKSEQEPGILTSKLPPPGGASSLPPEILKALEEDGY